MYVFLVHSKLQLKESQRETQKKYLIKLCRRTPYTYTTLNVPTVTSCPSVKCLQWSADGQVCFITKTAAYIMVSDNIQPVEDGTQTWKHHL